MEIEIIKRCKFLAMMTQRLWLPLIWMGLGIIFSVGWLFCWFFSYNIVLKATADNSTFQEDNINFMKDGDK